MYYQCKIYPTDAVLYVEDCDFDVIVSELLDTAQTLLIVGYLSKEKLPECYLQLKSVR